MAGILNRFKDDDTFKIVLKKLSQQVNVLSVKSE